MKHSFKLFPLFTAFILMVFASFILQTQTKPALYGKIYLKVSNGLSPLGEAKVELREVVYKNNKPEAGKLLFKTYSDSKGNFAFFRIPNGKYFLIVLRVTNAFFQLIGGNKTKMRVVTIGAPGTSQKLPDITVLK
jgi:hypothetical protein